MAYTRNTTISLNDLITTRDTKKTVYAVIKQDFIDTQENTVIAICETEEMAENIVKVATARLKELYEEPEDIHLSIEKVPYLYAISKVAN